MQLAPMPETAVDKDRKTTSGKGHVCPTADTSGNRRVDSKPEAASVESATKRQLRGSTATPLRLHAPPRQRTRRGRSLRRKPL